MQVLHAAGGAGRRRRGRRDRERSGQRRQARAEQHSGHRQAPTHSARVGGGGSLAVEAQGAGFGMRVGGSRNRFHAWTSSVGDACHSVPEVACLRPLWLHSLQCITQWPLPHPQTPSPSHPVYKVNRIWEGTPWTLCGTLNSGSTLNLQPSRASQFFTHITRGAACSVCYAATAASMPPSVMQQTICAYTPCT